MNENIWTGEKVKLRAWEPKDWEAQVRWREDTEGDRRTYHIPFPFSEAGTQKQAQEYAQRRSDEDDVFRGIIAKLDDSAVGVIGGNDPDRSMHSGYET